MKGAHGETLIERYQRDGYLVMEDLVSRSEVTELREEAEKLCLERRAALARDADPAYRDPLAAYLAIHFPHKLSTRLEALAHPRIVEVLTSLIEPNVKCMQSMLFIKHAGKPGQAWRLQDEDFIPTRDRSARRKSLFPWWRPGGPHPPTQDLRDVVAPPRAPIHTPRGAGTCSSLTSAPRRRVDPAFLTEEFAIETTWDAHERAA